MSLSFGGEVGSIAEWRHPEWKEHNRDWRWLLDSYEGGNTYRTATYGINNQNYYIRNLVRHKREYPDPGQSRSRSNWVPDGALAGLDPYAIAGDDDYALRLARTPVPTFMKEVVETHLSRLYAKEVDRDTDDPKLSAWWEDVDGIGTPVDRWVADTLAPLLLVFGCLDVCCDHPAPPKGVDILTRADEQVYRLDRCVASVILPENMVWWKLDSTSSRYEECLVCEYGDSEDRERVYRHWTATEWTLYDDKSVVLDTKTHPFRRVPIVRLFDKRRPRCRNVGVPRYEGVADLQREYYNRDSELILSDTTQAHPLLQGPEDYITPEGTVPIGPGYLLPKKKNTSGTTVSYEGFDVVEFPKDGADSIRRNKLDIRDAVDRDAKLTKPAGSAGTTGGTVSQSGVSKRLDHTDGNTLLAGIAAVLEQAEHKVAELAALVLYDGRPPASKPMPEPRPGEPMPREEPGTRITYPRTFDLMTAEEFAATFAEFQGVTAQAGALPTVEGELLCKLVRLMLPGKEDSDYSEFDREIETYLKAKSAERELAREAMSTMTGDINGSAVDAGQPAQPDAVTDVGDDQPDDAAGAGES